MRDYPIIKIKHPYLDATLLVGVKREFTINGKEHIYSIGVHNTALEDPFGYYHFDLEDSQACYAALSPVYATSIDSFINQFLAIGKIETDEKYGIRYV